MPCFTQTVMEPIMVLVNYSTFCEINWLNLDSIQFKGRVVYMEAFDTRQLKVCYRRKKTYIKDSQN